MTPLIADRFVEVAGGWLDIVTGRPADVMIGQPPGDPAERARLCEALRRHIPFGRRRLLDYGPLGEQRWFEAWTEGRSAGPHGNVGHIERESWPAISEIVRLIDSPDASGTSHVALVAPPGTDVGLAFEDLARDARRLGCVTLLADLKLSTELVRALLGRHLVLLVRSPTAARSAAEWVARLALVSNRRHLVVQRVETASAVPAGAVRVHLGPVVETELALAREREPVSGGASGAAPLSWTWPMSISSPASSSTPLLSRAKACERRGRLQASDRWFRAAYEAARRRRDESAMVSALESWVTGLVAAGRLSNAVHLSEQALRELSDPLARSTAARLAARAHMESADLTRADTCIEAAICLELLIAPMSRSETIATRAAIRFWQGRWKQGRAELDAIEAALFDEPAVGVWRELLSWADGAPQRYRWSRPVADEPFWSEVALLFRAARTGDARAVARQIEALADCAATRGLSARRWAAAASAQAWLECGDEDEARRVLAEASSRGGAHRDLAEAVFVALRGDRGDRGEDVEWASTLMRRGGARGVIRWGQGRRSMQMLQDVSKLLDITHEAEDERAALARVCDWARESSGATAFAIVAAPEGGVLAGSSLAEIGADARTVMDWLERGATLVEPSGAVARACAPIRYGGVVIGLAIGTSTAIRARALQDAVQAVAAVCGSMVRGRLDALQVSARADALSSDILGMSPAIRAVRATAARAAAAPFAVVIEGESGTGKELVARALHRLGPRRDRPFAALNCAALTDELVEAELFGHARGAFTHAVNARAGLFEEAHQGTLFLDEVGDLSARAQAKLLRALQEGEIRRVGENVSRRVDVRVIAATNRPLTTLAAEGRFREDLLFRLSVVKITVPPLRARIEDVPALAHAFWRDAARRVSSHAQLGPDAVAALCRSSWPGNVRQLQNAIAGLAVAAPARGRVTSRLVAHVLAGMDACLAGGGGPDELVPLDEARRQMERQLVTAALERHTGSRSAAARALGLSRQGLRKAMRRLGLAQAGVA